MSVPSAFKQHLPFGLALWRNFKADIC
jgi:hypothetical protein